MRRRPLILIITLSLLVITGCLALVLVRTSSVSTTSETMEVNVLPALTAGVILAGPAQDYGWTDPAVQNTPYAETWLAGHRILLFDQFNTVRQTGFSLSSVIEAMIERGANVIFVSSIQDFAPSDVSDVFATVPIIFNQTHPAEISALLPALAASQGGPFVVNPATEVPSTTTDDDEHPPVVGILVILLFLGITGKMVWSTLRQSSWLSRMTRREKPKKKRPTGTGPHSRALQIERAASVNATDFPAEGLYEPMLHKLSTYVHGDTTFDESFSIERRNGDFLGEVGVSPAHFLPPDREYLTTLDIWLFDKDANKTLALQLASEQTFNDPTLRAALEQKGPVRLAEAGIPFRYETDRLRVHIQILTLQYGVSSVLPARSFFDSIVIELAVWER